MKFHKVDIAGKFLIEERDLSTNPPAERRRVVFNTHDDKIYYSDGTNWIEIGTGSAVDSTAGMEIDVFTATSGQTTFTTSFPFNINHDEICVFVDGLLKQGNGSDYNELSSPNRVQFTSGLTAGSIVTIVCISGKILPGIPDLSPYYKRDGSTTLTGHMKPDTDNTIDIGDSTTRIRDIYLGPSSLHVGNDTMSEAQLTAIKSHVDSTSNPHNITDIQLGLNSTAINNHIDSTSNPHNITKSQIGLDQVTNTPQIPMPASPNPNDFLRYIGGQWIGNPSSVANHTIGGASHTDSIITSVQYGDVLTWDGTNWINKPPFGNWASDIEFKTITSTPDNGGSLTGSELTVTTTSFSFTIANFVGAGITHSNIRGIYLTTKIFVQHDSAGETHYIEAKFPDGNWYKLTGNDNNNDTTSNDVSDESLYLVPVNIGQTLLELRITNTVATADHNNEFTIFGVQQIRTQSISPDVDVQYIIGTVADPSQPSPYYPVVPYINATYSDVSNAASPPGGTGEIWTDVPLGSVPSNTWSSVLPISIANDVSKTEIDFYSSGISGSTGGKLNDHLVGSLLIDWISGIVTGHIQVNSEPFLSGAGGGIYDAYILGNISSGTISFTQIAGSFVPAIGDPQIIISGRSIQALPLFFDTSVIDGYLLNVKFIVRNYKTIASSIRDEYILIQDRKTSGTNGGTFTQGAWQTRDLNTIVVDDTGLVTLPGSNQFTLPAGTYEVNIRCPSYDNVNEHICRLYNVTDSSIELNGSTCRGNSGMWTESFIKGKIVITANKTFRVEHYCKNTVSTNGFGIAASITSTPEVYTIVELIRIRG